MKGWDIGEAPGRGGAEGPHGPGGGKPLRNRLLRAALTAVMLGTVLVRAVRIGRSRESVAGWWWYSGPPEPIWALVYAVMFLGPFAAALAAALAPWFRSRAANALWAAGFCGGGLFTLNEGLILFARAMGGHSAYVGAEPLLSLLVCLISGMALLVRWRASFLRNGRRPGPEPGGSRHD